MDRPDYIFPLDLNSAQIVHILRNQPNKIYKQEAKKEYRFLRRWTRNNFREGECLEDFMLSKRADNETHRNWRTILDWMTNLQIKFNFPL